MVAFSILFLWIIGFSLGIFFTKNLINSLIYFLAIMLAVVGIYLLLKADIMAISHLVLYVGGVIVLIMLGLMLSENRNRDSGMKNQILVNRFSLFWGILLAVLFVGLIFWGLKEVKGGLLSEPSQAENKTSLDLVGRFILTDWFFPFEYIGIFLLISLVFAAFIAKKHE